jgi:integrase
MASTKVCVPKYRLHRGSGQAFVQIKGKRHYLGVYDSPKSKEAYSRFIAELAVNPLPASVPAAESKTEITIIELCAAYWHYAESYYTKKGIRSGWLFHIRLVLRMIREMYGSTKAADFGPLALKAIRQRMIDTGKSRKYINKLMAVIPRIFKWAASEELLPGAVYGNLRTVEGLKKGRTTAEDHAPIEPVNDAVVDATLPNLPAVVADMVRFQRLTGARPGEVCQLRPMDVDRSGEVWEYRPASHKTEHHGKTRVIYIGPQAQAVLLPYLLRAPDAYCFSPVESEKKRLAEMRTKRKTKVQPSQRNRRKARRLRAPQLCYTKDSYCRAIRRGIEKANKKILEDAEKNGIDDPATIPHWHPNRLRHSAATAIRRQFGLEAAQVILGHSKADVTQIYAERDSAKAIEVVKRIG